VSDSFSRRVSLELADLTAKKLLRTLDIRESRQGEKIIIDGRKLINFCSNDYLGMASDAKIIKRVTAEVKKYGVGSGSASLLSGRSSLHAELEDKLARFAGTESALIFSSGYLANTGAIPSLLRKTDFIFHDRLNHASLIDGVLASNAGHKRYPHGQVPDLSLPILGESEVKMLVTESVFSMDGDLVDLCSLASTALENDSILYVDDAHGFGIIGNGRGAAGILGHKHQVPPAVLIMVPFGKALGSMGAALLGPQRAIDLLIQKARTYVYDTALPPVCVAAALQALELLENGAGKRESLSTNISFFRQQADKAEIPLQNSASPIQPIILGGEEKALFVSKYLAQSGFYVRAIRPPTVPVGTSRIRLTITAGHNKTQILSVIKAIKEAMSMIP